MTYEIKTEKYSGPLEKLLELILEKKLEITTFSLAEVTGDFLRYIRGLEGKSHFTGKGNFFRRVHRYSESIRPRTSFAFFGLEAKRLGQSFFGPCPFQ